MDASDRLRQCIAVIMGGLFVVSGFVLIFGDSQTASASTSGQDVPPDLIRDLAAMLGETWAGGLFIALGIGLTLILFRAASRL